MPLPLLPLALGGASFLGGLFGNKDKKQTQTQTTSTQLSPQASSLNDLILGITRERLGKSADISGYKTQGQQDINRTFDAAKVGLNADLTARGLSDSPAAVTPVANLATGRASSMAQFLTSLPMFQRKLQDDDLGFAQNQFALQPRTTTSTGVGTQQGQPIAGGFSDLGSMLGFLLGSGAFGQKRP